jgi:hypothetical protein
MKTGRTLQQLAAELERQVTAKQDYVAPQGALSAVVHDREVKIHGLNGGDDASIDTHAHSQIATHLGIPQKYYDTMKLAEPALLAQNVNTWLHREAGERRMVRTLDGRVRGFLSSKYRPLDNFDLAKVVLPVLLDHGVEVVSSELTETRMYIKGILPKLSGELPVGAHWGDHKAIDRGTVVSAITISNSEVGNGSLRVEPSVFTTWCANMAILAEAAMKKYHVGRSHDVADSGYEVFTDETRRADDRALWLKVGDITRAAFNEQKFRAAIEKIKATAQNAILSDDLPKVIDLTVQRLSLPEAVTGGILTHLAKGGDLSQWGLSSAITRVAGTVEDYELATAMERAGGQILALPAADWKVIATAA